jgi:hypothetical protein
MPFKYRYQGVLEIPEYIALDGTRASVAGRLIDFPTGKATLSVTQQECLRDEFIPKIAERPNFWVDLRGYASKKGQTKKNKELSDERKTAVKNFLEAELQKQGKTLNGKVNIDDAYGENAVEYIAPESNNDSYWRAVEIQVFGSRPAIVSPPKIKVPPAPPLLKRATGWTVSGGAGGGVSILVVSATGGSFFFTNQATGEKWRGIYVGGGVGLSVLPANITISTDSMPSTDGKIYSLQKISRVEDLTSGLTSLVGVNGTTGYFLALLFGAAPPVPSLLTLYNLYTLLASKQVLAVAGLAGVQMEAPDIGISASTVAFPTVIKQ